MKKLFFSGIKYKLRAVNQERLFTRLSEKQPMYFITRSSHTESEVFLKPQNEKTFEKSLKNFNVEIISKEYKGFLAHIKGFFARFGTVAGLVFCFVFMFGIGQFVLKTEIVGLENLSEQEVNNVLAENNLSGIVAKKNINTHEVESVIIKNFSSVGLVSVIIRGNTLVISIKEKISAGDYDNPDLLQPLVAKQSGLITNINLISGTLKVKIGQIIKIGDVLVEPYILDSSGQKRVVKADAEISARVWHKGKEVHAATRFEVERTGKVYKHVNISFLGISLTKPLTEPPFASYETITTKAFIANNTVLPVVRELVIFYETKSVQIEQSFESVKEEVFKKAKQKALQMVDEYEIINREYFTISDNFGITIVEYIIETERLIS